MSMTDAPSPEALELEKALASIRQMKADATRKEQEFVLAPRHLWITAVTAAAALMGAGAALFGGALALAKYLAG